MVYDNAHQPARQQGDQRDRRRLAIHPYQRGVDIVALDLPRNAAASGERDFTAPWHRANAVTTGGCRFLKPGDDGQLIVAGAERAAHAGQAFSDARHRRGQRIQRVGQAVNPHTGAQHAHGASEPRAITSAVEKRKCEGRSDEDGSGIQQHKKRPEIVGQNQAEQRNGKHE